MAVLRDVAVRAAKTAVQAFLAVVVASGTGFVSVGTLRAAALAGAAAGISALHNALLAAWGRLVPPES